MWTSELCNNLWRGVGVGRAVSLETARDTAVARRRSRGCRMSMLSSISTRSSRLITVQKEA